jgi:hypothetical protein
MSRVYKGQPWRLRLDTKINLDDATDFAIMGKKPGADEISFSATREGTSAIIRHDFSAAELDTAGNWTFQALVTFDSDPYRGEVVARRIFDLQEQ